MVFDAYFNREILVLAPVIACMCDNPRASEVVGHLQGCPNAYYRQYLVSCNIVLYTQSNIQADKNISPDIICALRTKSDMLDHFDAISTAVVISKG